MVHGCVEVRNDNHHFWFMMLTFYYKYLRCFLKVHWWIVFHLFSIPTYVPLRWSMASTIALLFLLVISIIDEKTLFQFFLIPILLCAVGVVKKNWLLIMIMEIDYLIRWWRTFHNNICFPNSCFNLSHSPKLELLHYCHLWIVHPQDSCHKKISYMIICCDCVEFRSSCVFGLLLT